MKVMKTMKIITVGYLILFTIGFLTINVFNINVKQMESLNLIEEMTWYRNAFYLLVIVGWPSISTYLVKRNKSNRNRNNAQIDAEIKYIKNAWWKIALFFVIFETLAVQKLWL